MSTERIEPMGNEPAPLFEVAGASLPAGPGALEQAVAAEIERKIEDGIMDRVLYAGQIAQALLLAREVDRSVGVGRPSGRAQIHDVLHRLLFDLPQPERAATSTELDKALEMIFSAGQQDEP